MPRPLRGRAVTPTHKVWPTAQRRKGQWWWAGREFSQKSEAGGKLKKCTKGKNHRLASSSWIVVKMWKWGWWADMELGQPWEENRWEFTVQRWPIQKSCAFLGKVQWDSLQDSSFWKSWRKDANFYPWSTYEWKRLTVLLHQGQFPKFSQIPIESVCPPCTWCSMRDQNGFASKGYMSPIVMRGLPAPRQQCYQYNLWRTWNEYDQVCGIFVKAKIGNDCSWAWIELQCSLTSEVVLSARPSLA